MLGSEEGPGEGGLGEGGMDLEDLDLEAAPSLGEGLLGAEKKKRTTPKKRRHPKSPLLQGHDDPYS